MKNMTRAIEVLVLVSLTCGVALPQQTPGRLLVQPRRGANPKTVSQTLAAHGASVEKTIPQINVHVLRVPPQAQEQVRQALLKTGLFTFAEPDAQGKGVLIPNDADYPSQWHLPQIQAPGAWDMTTGAGVTIAIVDSGIDPTHPDLAPNLVSGVSYIGGSTADVLGHGTHVAGAAAAIGNDVIGVAGVAWAKIMPLVVLNSSNWANYSDIASAITYAADSGARIINVSIAGTSASSTMQSAVNYAWNKGSVVFAAAGNYSTSSPTYPAACDNVVAISSTNSSDGLSSFSSFGSWIDIAAPGENILTTSNGGGYTYTGGTSLASPIAAGVGALVLSRNPSLSASALVSTLQNNADNIGLAYYFGAGRVNAYRAVVAAGSGGGDTTPPGVNVSSPGSLAFVSGTIQVTGTTSDNVGVVTTEFYADNQLVSSSGGGSPFSFSWNTTTVANGSHTLMVKAYDGSSNVGAASVVVNVNNVTSQPDSTPPSVTISNPANGSVYGSNTRSVKITVNASDNVALSQVTIYIDGVQVYTGSGATSTYTWNLRKATSGFHNITARAWDAAGNFSDASPVTIQKQ
jgi:thermitase